MENSELKFGINFGVYSNKLGLDMDANLYALKSILQSVASEGTSTFSPVGSGVVKMQIFTPNEDVVKKQEINKCFKACIAAFQDFADCLIGLLYMSRKKIKISQNITNLIELQAFLDMTENKSIQDVAKNKKLRVPDKLNILRFDDPQFRAMADGYFSLRNSIEHHKSISDRDVNLTFRQFTLLTDNEEITELPFKTKENTSLKLGIRDISRLISKNSPIEITAVEVYNIVSSIKMMSVAMTERMVNIIQSEASASDTKSSSGA